MWARCGRERYGLVRNRRPPRPADRRNFQGSGVMTLRIISENSARNLERSLHNGRDIGGSLQDTYMTRMTKLVPAEAITTYPLILNTVPSPRPWQMVLLVAAVVLVVVVVLRWSATKGPDGKAQWPAVILSAISFVIWVFVMG